MVKLVPAPERKTMQYILLFPGKKFLRWFIDDYGFLDVELIQTQEDVRG